MVPLVVVSIDPNTQGEVGALDRFVTPDPGELFFEGIDEALAESVLLRGVGREILLLGLVYCFGVAWVESQGLGAHRHEVVHPLIDLADSEIVTPGDLRGGGLALDDVQCHSGLAPGGPAFDFVWFFVHRRPPWMYCDNSGLPGPNPGKLSPA